MPGSRRTVAILSAAVALSVAAGWVASPVALADEPAAPTAGEQAVETPTEAATEAATAAPTEAPTEALTEAPTEAPSPAATDEPAVAPDAPTGVSAIGRDGAVHVTWTTPAFDGGSAVQSYEVVATPRSTLLDGSSVVPVDAERSFAVVNALVNGAVYDVTVTATNAAGDSRPALASATPRTTPGRPSIRSASAGDHTATVRWDAPARDGGAMISAYVVKALPSGNAVRVAGTARSAVVRRLPNGWNTTLTVTAVNAAGRGLPSPASRIVTPRARASLVILREPAPSVVFGQPSVVRAAVIRSDGRPVAAQRVHLLAKSSAESGWRQVASGVTGTRGIVTLRPTLRASSVLRLHHPPSAVAAPDVAPRSVAVAKRVTAWANRSSSRIGMTLVVRGRVAPVQTIGSPVVLLRRVSGSYVRLATGRMVTSRRYVIRYRPRAIGDYALHVRKAGDAARAAGMSPLIRHRVNPESAGDIARDILADNGTTLATVHLSSGADGATPLQNLVDVANGRLAHTSCFGSGGCGTTTLDRRMLRAVRAMGQRASLTVSEFAGGSHASGSAHYRGKAVDITWVYGQHVGWGSNYFMVVNLCRAYGANEIFSPSSDPWGGHSRHVHCGWP